MEMLRVNLSDDLFDEAVHGPKEGQPSLPDDGDVAIYVKKKATVEGSAGAVVTFGVRLPDGTMRRAQTVITVRNLMCAMRIISEWQKSGQLD